MLASTVLMLLFFFLNGMRKRPVVGPQALILTPDINWPSPFIIAFASMA